MTNQISTKQNKTRRRTHSLIIPFNTCFVFTYIYTQFKIHILDPITLEYLKENA